jgi:hypothetical protein
MTYDQVKEVVRSFVETQRSYEGDLAPEGIYVRDPELAGELGVGPSPNCGVFLSDGTDVPLEAAAGPDGLGNWNGVDADGRVHEYLSTDDLAEW